MSDHPVPSWLANVNRVTSYDIAEALELALHIGDRIEWVKWSDVLAACPPSQEELAARVAAFVERCRDIRNGSPNAFYQHVDAFCATLAVSPPPSEARDWQPPRSAGTALP
jgi:hypothetical protein